MTEAMVIRRPDGVVRRVAGYRYAEPDSGATKFTSKLKKPPATVDLRGQLNPVQDHGETNSAVAHAVAAAYEHLYRRHGGDQLMTASRLFVYYNARKQAGNADDDSGSSIADTVKGVIEYGACSSRTWPFDLDRVLEEPPPDAYDEASTFTIDAAELVPVKLATWKKALASGHPIVFGLYVYESFDRQRQPGLVPIPSDHDIEREQGEHAMLCVGYSEADEVFVVRNSWGPAWGDQGYCYIPFDYLMDEDLNLGDAWVLRKKDTLPADKSTWSKKSLLEDVETPLGRMDDKEWTALLDSLGDYALETRLALIFLAAAEADEDVTEAQISDVAGALETAFEHLGSPFEADRVVRESLSLLDEGALIDDSIVLIGEHFDEEALTTIVRAAAAAARLDDLSGAEEGTLADLVDAWLGGAAPREGGLVDGLVGEYDDVDYAGGVYGDDDGPDDFSDGFGELE